MEHIFQGKNLLSLVLGLILLTLGIIPILNTWGVIGFNLPGFLVGIVSQVLIYLIAGSGLWLLVDGFQEGMHSTEGKITVWIGFLVLLIGVINLLQKFKILPFGVPFLTAAVYSIIFAIEGILLVVAAFVML